MAGCVVVSTASSHCLQLLSVSVLHSFAAMLSFVFVHIFQTLLLQVKREADVVNDKLRADFAASKVGIAFAAARTSKTAGRMGSAMSAAKTGAVSLASAAVDTASKTQTAKLLGKASTLVAPMV